MIFPNVEDLVVMNVSDESYNITDKSLSYSGKPLLIIPETVNILASNKFSLNILS